MRSAKKMVLASLGRKTGVILGVVLMAVLVMFGGQGRVFAKEQITQEKAHQLAEEWVTLMKRLEATPDYQKMREVIEASKCGDGFCPTDADDYFVFWLNIDSIMLSRYSALQNIDEDEEFKNELGGVTGELTVENITKLIFLNHDKYKISDMFSEDNLNRFKWLLAILQANTAAEKIVRLFDIVAYNDTIFPWMELIAAVDRLESDTEDEINSSFLSDIMTRWAGDTSHLSTEQKLQRARDLSDYGQARALFDEFKTVYSGYGDQVIFPDWIAPKWWIYRGVQDSGYTEEELAQKFESLVTKAKLLDADVMDGFDDYHLVLASIETPEAPDAGELGETTERGILTVVSVTAMGAVAFVIGTGVVLKLYRRKVRF